MKKIAGLNVLGLVLGFNAISADFSNCRFNFGMAFAGPDANYPAEVDFVSVWAGSDDEFNVWWHGALLNACLPGGSLDGRTPAYYSYIIAFTARRDWGLQDCDVGTPSLCQQGAKFIREQKARILSQYEHYAARTAEIWPTDKPMLWLMEPDFFQYAHASEQEGGPLTYTEAGELMAELVAIIKKHLPGALISLDISPWVPRPEDWYGSFNLSDFSYLSTSGGRTEAGNTRIRTANPTTWRQLHTLTGLNIIADDGYGVAGASIGHDDTWDDVTNLTARIEDGVIAINQANPKPDWNTTLVSVRPQLGELPDCGTGIIPGVQGDLFHPLPVLSVTGTRVIIFNQSEGRDLKGRRAPGFYGE